MSASLPVALTMGEPAGIGGEISLKSWARLKSRGRPFFLIDDITRLQVLNNDIGLDIPLIEIRTPSEAIKKFSDGLPVLPLSMPVTATNGQPGTVTASAVLSSIERATELTMAGEAAAIVTNPIQKEVLYEAGFDCPGHTEFIARLSGNATPVMMLASPMLRVVPVTVHMALRRALETLTTEMIVAAGEITIAALSRDFGVETPRLAVAGLNPHAGEGGTLGIEDDEIIQPAIEVLKDNGARVFGPVPPDALFTARARSTYDAALCMYHDQALIPIKALDFDNAVNVTIGLPVVRTSPDHGTALDIAGKGIADETSLVAAINLAFEIFESRQTTKL